MLTVRSPVRVAFGNRPAGFFDPGQSEWDLPLLHLRIFIVEAVVDRHHALIEMVPEPNVDGELWGPRVNREGLEEAAKAVAGRFSEDSTSYSSETLQPTNRGGRIANKP